MAFSRAAALRSCFRGARPSSVRPQLWRQVARRGYASEGHASAKAGGDAVWAAGAVGVTVPACWYLLSNAPDTSHGHGDHEDHDDSHGQSHDEEDGEESKDEEKPEESEKKDDDNDSEKSEDSDSDDEKKKADTPDTSDDEGKEDSKNPGNESKHIPDAKGGAKKRIESEKGMKQGEEADSTDDSSGPKDKAASSKPPGGKNTQSGKQEGLSNTDTKHSTDITNNPDKSKKGEGSPETAKSKGTVDPKRPQPEKK